MQAPIGNGALVHPRAEHRANSSPELEAGVLREWLAVLGLEALLVTLDKLDPVLSRKVGVQRVAAAILVVVKDFFEMVMTHAQDDVRVHCDEATIGIISEALVAGASRQRLHCLVVEPEVKHRIHHAGHGCASAGAHRYK